MKEMSVFARGEDLVWLYDTWHILNLYCQNESSINVSHNILYAD